MFSTAVPTLAFLSPSAPEMMIIGVIALLLFGKRLPEVARSMGKGLVEFKKGMQGIEDEVRSTTSTDSFANTSGERPAPPVEHAEVTAPKFEPPSLPPQDDSLDTSHIDEARNEESHPV